MELAEARISEGKDIIFFNSPVLIIVSTPYLGNFSAVDTTAAFTYGQIAAHALGLGTCWIGYCLHAVTNNRRIKKLLGIPKTNRITGVMTIGYPEDSFKRIPPRKPIEAAYL